MNPEIARFSHDVATNEALRGAALAVVTDQASAISFANSRGYNFTSEDVTAAVGEDGAISDELLEGVTGGSGRFAIYNEYGGICVVVWN